MTADEIRAARRQDAYGWGMRSITPIAWLLSAATLGYMAFGVVEVWQPGGAWVPVRSAPFLPGGQTGDLYGGFTEGSVFSAVVPDETRWWWTVLVVASSALLIAVALTVARIVSQLRNGKGFTSVLPRSLGILAVVVLVLGVVTQLSAQLAAYFATLELFGEASDPPGTVPGAVFAVQFDFWPVWAGLAIGALAFAFDRAARLQRDTEGLV